MLGMNDISIVKQTGHKTRAMVDRLYKKELGIKTILAVFLNNLNKHQHVKIWKSPFQSEIRYFDTDYIIGLLKVGDTIT